MTIAVLVPTDGPARIVTVDLTGAGDLRALVGGGFAPLTGKGWTALVNDEGMRDNLPSNRVADTVARRLGWVDFPFYVLQGPVVFLGPLKGDNWTDCPEFVRAEIEMEEP